MDVVLVRWPEESRHLEDLRISKVARLLLVAPGAIIPESSDCLEDWVRLPADDADVRARAASLSVRAELHGAQSEIDDSPVIDDHGLMHFRSAWVSLSPVEQRLAKALVDRFRAVVGRDSLSKRAWPEGVPKRNALDVHMLRLRRRIAPIGLEIRTVRSRGYLLQESRHITVP